MPLLDHFHPPLKRQRHWESFHGRWAAAMADALNQDILPPDYFAEFQVHVGSRVEIDVATFERGRDAATGGQRDGATATLTARAWAPPKPAWTMPAIFPDEIEVQVFSTEEGPELVAAIELVSPGNKDRPDFRRAFAAKCASYLHRGIGLIIVDIVTSRQANLHNELVALLGQAAQFVISADSCLYTVAYRPTRRDGADQLDVWPSRLLVGSALPVVPLGLRGAGCVPLDLDATYQEACQRSRIT